MKLKTTYVYDYTRVNDGSPSPYSDEQMALTYAFHAYYEAGHYEWKSVTIEKLACDDSEHYPNACWHFRVTIKDEGQA